MFSIVKPYKCYYYTTLEVGEQNTDSSSSPAVPTGTVTNVAVESVDGGLRVSFDPITDPTVARGNVSYMVCYTTQTNATMACEITQMSPTIISVPGNEVLNVTVTPFTAAGVGMSTGGVVFGKRTHAEHNMNLANQIR